MTVFQQRVRRKRSKIIVQGHQWVVVVNPSNHRSLLQACDNCGVVKSENSVIRHCTKRQGQHLITDSMASGLCITI